MPDIGKVTVDVAYGGMTFVMVDATRFGFELVPSEARAICSWARPSRPPPPNSWKPFIRKTRRSPASPICASWDRFGNAGGLAARNATVVSPGRLDRSPCGTGTSARLAIMHAKGQIETGQQFIHESVIGSKFISEVAGTTKVGKYDAVIPAVAGRCWITHISQHGLDPSDPFPQGYTLSDAWLTAI